MSKKKPPTLLQVLHWENRERVSRPRKPKELHQRRQVDEGLPGEDVVRRPQGHREARCLIWLQYMEDGEIKATAEPRAFRWFYPETGPRYMTRTAGNLLEYYILGVLDTKTHEEELSLGVVTRLDVAGPEAHLSSLGTRQPRPVPSPEGCVLRLLAVDSDKSSFKNTRPVECPDQLRKVLHKKRLHLGSLPGDHPGLDVFHVLETDDTHHAWQMVRRPDTSDADFQAWMSVIDGNLMARNDPWEVLNRLAASSEDLAKIHKALDAELTVKEPRAPVIEGVGVRRVVMPPTVVESLVVPYRVMDQAEASASIPTGKLYIPKIIDGRFVLFRERKVW